VSEDRLTHIDATGRARMVDVGGKDVTERVARARARVRMSPAAARRVRAGDGPKGEVLGVARLAGIQAAKQTATLIPLAHPLELSFVDVAASVDETDGVVELIAEARTRARTGVEMEAMTACAVAALAVYDMVKGIERGVAVEEVILLEKRGGRSDYLAPGEPGAAAPGAAMPPSDASPPSGAALLTISTSRAAGDAEDASGPALAALAARLGLAVVAQEILPDDRARIEARLRHLADELRCALILTSGGTGLAPSDVTPEATAATIQRPAPGIAEALRDAAREHTPNWMLSRGSAGVRGATLIVNLPGSPASIEQSASLLEGPLQHALDLIAGRRTSH
jgi:cyclic pyranopterin monophosphate synthase